jgi:hypothetical protein
VTTCKPAGRTPPAAQVQRRSGANYALGREIDMLKFALLGAPQAPQRCSYVAIRKVVRRVKMCPGGQTWAHPAITPDSNAGAGEVRLQARGAAPDVAEPEEHPGHRSRGGHYMPLRADMYPNVPGNSRGRMYL